MATENRLKRLADFGQSFWIDAISRGMLQRGELQRLIEEDGLKGLTSNPSIFEKSIGGDDAYKPALRQRDAAGERDPEKVYEQLAFQDIRDAADQMLPVYQASGGGDGFVSIEVAPRHAHDTEGTVRQGMRIWQTIARPNIMIKVPATPEGLPAIEALIAQGINVNVTLLFAVQVYEQVAAAYCRGLEKRRASGESIDSIASVASFFVSRIDAVVDRELERRAQAANGPARQALLDLRGRTAIANAKRAYERYGVIYGDARWVPLQAAGARPQRLLWASTSTKNEAYPDTLYVDELIGPETVNTLPPATIDAFRDHGHPALTLESDKEAAEQTLQAVAAAGVDLCSVAEHLLSEGVQLFADSYDRLLTAVGRAREAA